MKLSAADLKSHSGIVGYASVFLRKTDGREKWAEKYDSEEDCAQVDECLARFFDGDADEMYEHAMDWLSGGCGVSG